MNLPAMIAVESSKIKEVGYDSKEQALFVRFNSDNSVWRYHKVIQENFDDMMKAESIGAYHGKLARAVKNVNRVYEVDDNPGEWIMK